MADNRVRLIHEIDGSASLATAAQIEQRFDRAHGAIDKGAQRTARIASQAARAMSAGIGAVTAANAASERQWLSLGTSILASFAAGGPIAGGIAVLAAGLGIVYGKLQDGNRAQEEAERNWQALRERAKGYHDVLTEIAFLEREGRAPTAAEAEAERLRREIARLEDMVADDFKLGKEEEAAEQNLAIARGALSVQLDIVAAEREKLDILEEQKLAVEEIAALDKERMSRALAGLGGAQSGLSSAQSFAAALNRPRTLGEDLARRIGGARGELDHINGILRQMYAAEGTLTQAEVERGKVYQLQAVALEEQLGIYEDLVPLVEKIESPEHRFEEFFARQADALRTSIGPALSQTFADIVTDGFENGFDNAADIAKRFLFGLLNQAINLGATSILGGLFPSLFVARGAAFAGGRVMPFARGGVVDRPTLFPMANGMGLMGEAGPEAVLPLRRGRGGRLGVESSGGATIHLGGIHLSPGVLDLPDAELERVVSGAVVRALRSQPGVARAAKVAARRGL